MKNHKIVVLIIFAVILLLMPFVVYMCNFIGYNISKDTEIWGSFGNYLNGTFMLDQRQ